MLTADNLRPIIAKWFASVILYKQHVVIDDSCNPPWDCSGQPKITGKLNLEDYDKLEGFLEEYTGNSQATYVSGCGLYHETFEDDLENLVQEQVHTHMMADGAPNDSEDWSDDLWDEETNLICAVLKSCSQWSCKELFAEGDFSARMDEAIAQADAKVRVMEREAKVYAGRDLINKHGLVFNKTVCKKTLQWTAARSKLLKLSEDERKCVALVLNASESIRRALENGKVP
jgi:hypothetical protein